MILVDILIVKGSISFIEEKTGYSLLFPIFILVLVSLLQFWILFFCFYVKEILGQSFVFKEEIMLENQTLRGYQNRESLVFLEEVMQLAIQLFLLSFFSRNKDMYIVILTVNGIASLIIYYIYTEIWFAKCFKEHKFLYKKILNGLLIISIILLLRYPEYSLLILIGGLLVLQAILNRKQIRRSLRDKDS